MKAPYGHDNIELTGPVHDGVCIRQQFEAKTQRLISVDIYFATYKRENPGTVIVEITDLRHRVLTQARVDSTALEDNAMREFGMGVNLLVGNNYELKIYTEHCRAGMSPTCAYGNGKEGGALFVGARLVRSKELYCNFNYEELDTSRLPESPKVRESQRPPIPEDAIEGLVSVVIPHFNCPEYLAKCLATIAKQTYSCMEVMVIDDGSEKKNAEKAKEVVESFRWAIPSIRSFGFRQNRGAPAARNYGASEARGEYLFFCDSDIYLYSETFETLIRTLLRRPDAAFAYGGFIWGAERVLPVKYDEEKLRKSNYVTTMSMMRRAYFPGWDENLKRHQDWDMWLTIVDAGGVGACCGRFLFETPVRDGISTNENIDMMASRDIVARKHMRKKQ